MPEPLQAVALTAMEHGAGAALSVRARDGARTCGGTSRAAPCWPGRLSTPRRWAPASGRTSSEIGEWLRLRLIYPHEAERLQSAYRALDAREDDWIVESRTLSYTQIALYLGAFLLLCGSLFYFVAAALVRAVDGVAAAVRRARAAVRRA